MGAAYTAQAALCATARGKQAPNGTSSCMERGLRGVGECRACEDLHTCAQQRPASTCTDCVQAFYEHSACEDLVASQGDTVARSIGLL